METAKEFLDKVNAIKGIGDYQDIKVQKRKAMFAGAAVGGGFGLYYGYAKKHNLLLSFVIGGVIGGLVARVFLPD